MGALPIYRSFLQGSPALIFHCYSLSLIPLPLNRPPFMFTEMQFSSVAYERIIQEPVRKEKDMDRKLWRMILICASICICAAMLASCSSDHDDDGVSPVSEEQVSDDDQQGAGGGNNQPAAPEQSTVAPGRLDLYTFTIDGSESTPLLTLRQLEGQKERTADMRSNNNAPVTGTYAPATGLVTLNAGTSLNVTLNNFWGQPSKGITITVTHPIVFLENVPAVDEEFPSQGSFAVIYEGNYFNVTFLDTDPNGGVRLMLKNSPSIEFDAQAFEGLLDAPGVPIWQQKANLAYLILDMLADQIALAGKTSDVIDLNRSGLASGGITTPAAQFSPSGQPNPFPATVSRTLTWTDTASDGQVGAGDSFLWQFVWAWDNGTDVLVADLTNGQVVLSDYARMTQQRNGQDVITSYGFAPAGQNPGGVTYTNLTQVEVNEYTPGTVTFNPNSEYILNGEFSILFTEPASAGGGS